MAYLRAVASCDVVSLSMAWLRAVASSDDISLSIAWLRPAASSDVVHYLWLGQELQLQVTLYR